MPVDTRVRLAQEQAALVAALAGYAAPPSGFDADRIHAAAVALASKRRRSVARAWPGLAELLGDRFAERFEAYAESFPLPRVGGPLADGRAFVRWLSALGELPEACRLPVLIVDLRYANTGDGLVRRGGFVLKTAFLPKERRLVIGVRLPCLGEHWLSLPMGRYVRSPCSPIGEKKGEIKGRESFEAIQL
jgi:hypothetical protein